MLRFQFWCYFWWDNLPVFVWRQCTVYSTVYKHEYAFLVQGSSRIQCRCTFWSRWYILAWMLYGTCMGQYSTCVRVCMRCLYVCIVSSCLVWCMCVNYVRAYLICIYTVHTQLCMHIWIGFYVCVQTNVKNNNNKFYIIQLLEDNDSHKFSVWFRWGRGKCI